jgi:hypothetical protein
LWLIRGIAGRRGVVQLPWIAELKAEQIGQQNGYFNEFDFLYLNLKLLSQV